jgi:uncharacterized protein YbbC (DUF1343 family)
MVRVRTGLETLLASPPQWLKGRSLGLLCNPASVDGRLRHSRERINDRFPGQLKALYSPQHGFYAEKQDNMIESADRIDPLLNLPVFSLYGHTRIPTDEMLEAIDVLLVDLLDVGTRVYTFIYTVSYCLERAASCNKQVVILDRPNPIGGRVTEGNCLQRKWASFVGRYPLPMRHGLTIGELASLINREFAIGCDLKVIPMQGWQREMHYDDTGLPWVAPSPNLPTPTSALVYPGQVIWEGTNVSEGRGTTQPFELFGAPYFDVNAITEELAREPLPGCTLRKVVFEPTSNKWQDQTCKGFQLHVHDRQRYRSYPTSLRILQAVLHRHPEQFDWQPPPYEYEHEKLPIDLIIGDGEVRRRLASREPLADIEADWQPGLAAFDETRRKYFLYE